MSDPSIAVQDHVLNTDQGDLLARSWSHEREAGPTIILFHDSLGSVELWRHFPERLAQATGLRVIAYDRFGFGRSDANSNMLQSDFMGDEARTWVPRVLRFFGIDRFIAVGHSVGGAMAVAAGAEHSAACAGVITLAAQAFVEGRTVAGIEQARKTFADPAQIARLARYHGDKAAWVLSAWIDTWLAPDFAFWSLDADLARLKCSILAIHGDRDEYGSVAHPNRIKTKAGGGAQVVVLPACGHIPHRERQADVLALIGAFAGTLD